ncbi:hypothetical protein A3753_30770 [Sulfitobacter sp. HI0082]|uniref:replication initiation protein n=1 Tax=unclassified Sulfitobacter TaxID=196795 RepID=UPI0007CF8436|nr:hypothetical protein A3753_30770 [Sulfitobacter sp. HI0082]|tara:strand:+ start:1227 stop:2090 length:864 start_codon:yes stop_codon:yes gene_type:complete
MSKDPKPLVVDQRPNNPNNTNKPQELIQIRGHGELTLTARRAITLLWQNAHADGIAKGKEYSIEASRLRSDNHKGRDNINDAIDSLMGFHVKTINSEGEPVRAPLVGGNVLKKNGIFTYTFDDKLVEVLLTSNVWGAIDIPVLMSFSSKYAVSLYEHVAGWINLERKTDAEFSLHEFRELLGVEAHKYPAFGDLNSKVIKPSLDEVNALAPFNVGLIFKKKGRSVATVKMNWWRKDRHEQEQAYQEHQRPRVGRRARIQGRVEYVSPPMPSEHTLARRARNETSDQT